MLNPYAPEGIWVKVNLHMHTSRSDGRWEPGAAIAAYRRDGYQAVAVTDHDLLFDPAKEPSVDNPPAPGVQAGGGSVASTAGVSQTAAGQVGQSDAGLLVIPGQEVHLGADRLDRCEYHIVGLGTSSAIRRQRTGQEAVDAIRAQGGLALLCHPLWSDMRQEEMDAIRGCVAVEVWNGVCERLLGRGNSVFYWDSYLSRFDPQPLSPVVREPHHPEQSRRDEPPRPLWGVAVDDTHRYPDDVGSGWVWVQLGERPAGGRPFTVDALLAALRRGAFYSSQGPRIETVLLEGHRLVVHTSSAVAVRFVGSGGRVWSRVTGAHVKSAEYDIAGDERYVRVEVEDRSGRVAWSNPIWVAPLEGSLRLSGHA